MVSGDITGKQFGRLTVLGLSDPSKHKKYKNYIVYYWDCQCSCGNIKSIRRQSLTSGNTTSCGCYRLERVTKHGFNGKNLEKVYTGMLARCNNPKHISFNSYGGKGIKVCKEWQGCNGRRNFFQWSLDNGYEPGKGLTLDRFPDRDGPYSPENCRWVTIKEQARNKNSNTIVSINGEDIPVSEAVERYSDLTYNQVLSRLTNGWSVESALTLPIRGKHSNTNYFIVTGGLGFLGSCLVNFLIKNYKTHRVIIIDKKTYAANINNLDDYGRHKRYDLIVEDICNFEVLEEILSDYRRIDCIFHLAAESMVDRSINSASEFINSNVMGTLSVLDLAKKFSIPLIYQSTDEIFGSLDVHSSKWDEESCIDPKNPYAATKAAGEHLVKSYINTHKIKAKVLRSCNVFGQNQHPEKFIKKSIELILQNQPVQLYVDGSQLREWIYQDDYCTAIDILFKKGWNSKDVVFNTYSDFEISNKDLATYLLNIVHKENKSFQDWYEEHRVEFIGERPGHDYRYSMSGERLKNLGWEPKVSFEEGLKRTIDHYKEIHNARLRD